MPSAARAAARVAGSPREALQVDAVLDHGELARRAVAELARERRAARATPRRRRPAAARRRGAATARARVPRPGPCRVCTTRAPASLPGGRAVDERQPVVRVHDGDALAAQTAPPGGADSVTSTPGRVGDPCAPSTPRARNASASGPSGGGARLTTITAWPAPRLPGRQLQRDALLAADAAATRARAR